MSNKLKIFAGVFFIFCSHLAISNAEILKQNILANINHGDIISTTQKKQNTNQIDFEENEFVDKSIYTVGDIMLGRDVERRLLKYGSDFPYQKINFKDEDAFVIANFESAIPATHILTPDNTFKFSVNKKLLFDLKEAGFTHVSLANNHTFDFGLAGYNNTVSALWENDLIPFGHPSVLSNSSVSIIETKGIKVSIIALHTLFGTPTNDNIKQVLSYAKSVSDFQIIYVHWGEEYSQTQSDNQRKLASILAFEGADIIIGHHPHVTQGIEKIKDTLVFYSLGNYIFDQYFSRPVQNGLMLNLSFENKLKIELIPINSETEKIQPERTVSVQKDEILTKIAESSSTELIEQIKQGFIYMDIPLATSSEVAIMAK